VLPLVFLLRFALCLRMHPFFNTHIRTNEHEADMYGLNASRQPDGFAQAAIHLGEYRKMNPGPIEEWIFFDHPSGRIRNPRRDALEGRKLAAFHSEAAKSLLGQRLPHAEEKAKSAGARMTRPPSSRKIG